MRGPSDDFCYQDPDPGSRQRAEEIFRALDTGKHARLG